MSDNRALVRMLTLVGGSLAIAIFVTFFLPSYLFPTPAPPAPPLGSLLQVKVFFSTFTTVLLLILILIYGRIYRELPNQFTLSLLLFIISLTLYALTANPLAAVLFGFRPLVGLGPFTFLPDMFASVSVIILLYQSHK